MNETERAAQKIQAALNVYTRSVLVRQPNGMMRVENYTPEGEIEAIKTALAEYTTRAEESQLLLDEANRQIVQLRNAFGKYVADRDAEIREELEAEYERVKEENTGLMGDYDLETAGTLSGLSFAISLAEEGGGAMNEQRKEIAKVLSAEKCKPHKRQMIDGITATTWDEADAVIAHLWERADDPATYAEVASKMYRRHDLNTFELGTAQQYMSMMLETLLGPRPAEQEAE